MLFPTLNFGLFFLVVFGIAWALQRRQAWRLGFLIVASYVFYGMWDWRFCFLLAASSIFNWFMGACIFHQPRHRKWLIWLAVGANLAALGFFKYCNFFLATADAGLAALHLSGGIPLVDVVLPVGISFFTFHGISYVVDIYRGKIAQPAPLLHVLFYISFFPQLVAGPIVRASHFMPQIAAPVNTADIRARRALLLIIGGLFKKVVLANYLATNVADDVFFDPTQYGLGDLLFANYAYAAQIYCDFSAYTDIAIGVAALFGYRFPWNFNQPYRAMGLQDFWQRWHISLSSWLRDYLYISLGGNRLGVVKRYRNLFLTMLLGGLWHGASWNFVLWGAMHGAALVVEHMFFPGGLRAGLLAGWQRGLAVAVTFQFVCFTWVFFRAADFTHAMDYFAGFARVAAPMTLLTPFNVALLVVAMALHALPQNWVERVEYGTRRVPLLVWGALAGAAIVAVDALGPSGVAPFIYFQF
jgi:D-alanyl-lipoteichoic acid acyltransferase DltB (MBOAT superfamily)